MLVRYRNAITALLVIILGWFTFVPHGFTCVHRVSGVSWDLGSYTGAYLFGPSRYSSILNPCRGTTSSLCVGENHNDPDGICQGSHRHALEAMISYIGPNGHANTLPDWEFIDDTAPHYGIRLKFIPGDVCWMHQQLRTSTISFICDGTIDDKRPADDQLIFDIDEEPLCTYNIDYRYGSNCHGYFSRTIMGVPLSRVIILVSMALLSIMWRTSISWNINKKAIHHAHSNL